MDENPETVANTDAVEPEQEKKGGLSFPAFLAIVVLASLSFRSFAFSLYSIPSESMLPRLMNGDYLVASKWNYGFTRNSLPFDIPLISGRIFAGQPERGDVVIFKHPVDGTDYIKRVIGLPGDMISIQEGRISINGELVPQEVVPDIRIPVSENTNCAWGAEQVRDANGGLWCEYAAARETLPNGVSYDVFDFGDVPQDYWGPEQVPEGMLFLMGDNRDNSQDSRFAAEPGKGIGFVPQLLLVGKAQMILWSTDGSAEWLKPWTWFTAGRDGRMGNGI
ncbi:signal peptidase I [Parerythrobacter aestuarii]|uniref:signal peptidase I n=1 Tax=Parerythrobacter aestuarii TaxID=3020909 RepID=UPI0024DEA516|nr:signal peptidase I [Parerythrobacter aestuarii]